MYKYVKMLLFAENKLFFVETFEQNPPKNVSFG